MSVLKILYQIDEKSRRIFKKNLVQRLNQKKIAARIKDNIALSSNQKHSVKEFYRNYEKVGLVNFRYYLEKTGHFDVRFIADSIWHTTISSYFNDMRLANYLDNKCLYHLLFPKVRQPELLAWRLNRIWYCREHDGSVVSSDKAIGLMKGNDCFVKLATNSCGGRGVFFFSNAMDVDGIKNTLNKNVGHNDIVVQKRICQSSTMARLNESSVNTLRVQTLLDRDGTVKILSTIVRMGIGGATVDNASIGGITCGVTETGRLKSVAYNIEGRKYDSHPDTGLHFEDITIPNYDSVLSMVKEVHPKVPWFRLVAWDIALDEEDQPILLEFNTNGELGFLQLNNGPVFGDDTKAILDEVYKV